MIFFKNSHRKFRLQTTQAVAPKRRVDRYPGRRAAPDNIPHLYGVCLDSFHCLMAGQDKLNWIHPRCAC